MSVIHSIRFPLLIILLLIQVGCGWQLRGVDADQAAMPPLDLRILQPKSFSSTGSYDFVDSLELYSRQNGASVNGKGGKSIDRAKAIVWTIDVVNYDLQERSTSLNSSNRSQQRQLFAEVRYRLVGNNLAQSNAEMIYEASVVRFFRYDENNVLATNRERETIVNGINRDLSRQLWRQLRSKVAESSLSTRSL